MDNARSIKPTFSFVLPTYNTPLNLLRECLQSLLVQTYPYFEICIADDASTHRDVIALLIEYASQDELHPFASTPTKRTHLSSEQFRIGPGFGGVRCSRRSRRPGAALRSQRCGRIYRTLSRGQSLLFRRGQGRFARTPLRTLLQGKL